MKIDQWLRTPPFSRSRPFWRRHVLVFYGRINCGLKTAALRQRTKREVFIRFAHSYLRPSQEAAYSSQDCAAGAPPIANKSRCHFCGQDSKFSVPLRRFTSESLEHVRVPSDCISACKLQPLIARTVQPTAYWLTRRKILYMRAKS